MARRNPWFVWWAMGMAMLGLAIWGGYVGQSAASPHPTEEKSFPLTPGITFVKAGFMTGQFENLKVTEGVDRVTGKVVDPPVLRGVLHLRNDSTDQSAHLIEGRIEYRDAEGKTIPLPKTPGAPAFTFIAAPTDRLDPGKEMSQAIEAPFPTSGLKPDGLSEVSLELTYLPIPYREDTVNIPVSLGPSVQAKAAGGGSPGSCGTTILNPCSSQEVNQ